MLREFKAVTIDLLLKRARHFSTSGAGDASRKLEGKVALITGGASGIGKATASEFVRHGAKVIIADVSTTLGQETASELGPAVHFLRCDVSQEADLAAAVETATSRHGQLDIMFNNAGIPGPMVPPSIADLDLGEFDRVMSVNVRGAVAGIKHAVRVMIPAGTGSILCTSSICGLVGGAGTHAYSISKFAIPGIIKSAASELCRYGIRINCISPAPIPTPMVYAQLRMMYPGAPEEKLAEIVYGLGELKREKCEEADVAKAALYLASDDAKVVTGHNLVVDGGFTCFKSLGFPPPEHVP